MGVCIRLFGGAPSSIFREVGCNRFLLGDGEELILPLSRRLSFLSPFASEWEAMEWLLSDRCCIILGLPWTVVIISPMKSLCYARLLVSIAAFTQDNRQHSPADSDIKETKVNTSSA